MSALHARGEPCPVIELLVGHFGEKDGMYLLWGYTCFPFDDTTALGQAEKLVSAHKDGRLGEFLTAEDEKIERAMQDASTRAAT